MGGMNIERVLGAMEERSITTLKTIELINQRQIDIEKRIRKLETRDCSKHDDVVHDISELKVRQEQIIANSNVEDEKIRGLVNVNSVKVSGLTTTLLLLLQWVVSHVEIR